MDLVPEDTKKKNNIKSHRGSQVAADKYHNLHAMIDRDEI
jgi:hypothetical protein